MLIGIMTPQESRTLPNTSAVVPDTEELRPLALAVDWLPTRRRGRPAHAATLFRWASKGLHGVRLEVVQVGGTKCTSKQALQRFFAKLTEVSKGQESTGV